MQTRHVLITLLVAAHVLVALAVVAWEDDILLVLVAVGQIGLLSIWTALGRRAAPWRPAVLVVAIAAWIWVTSPKSGVGDPYLLVVFLLIAATTVAILAAARVFGLRLSLPDDDPTENDDGPWQFSLSQLFAWTTSLSICMGLLSLTFRHFNDGSNLHWLTIAVVAIVLTAIIMISLLCLAWVRLRFRNLVALVIFQLLALLLLVFWFVGSHFLIGPAPYFCLELLLLVGSLVVVRVAGYRLGFTRKWAAKPQAAE